MTGGGSKSREEGGKVVTARQRGGKGGTKGDYKEKIECEGSEKKGVQIGGGKSPQNTWIRRGQQERGHNGKKTWGEGQPWGGGGKNVRASFV